MSGVWGEKREMRVTLGLLVHLTSFYSNPLLTSATPFHASGFFISTTAQTHLHHNGQWHEGRTDLAINTDNLGDQHCDVVHLASHVRKASLHEYGTREIDRKIYKNTTAKYTV